MYPKLNDEEIKDQTNPLVLKSQNSSDGKQNAVKVQYEILETRNVKNKSKCAEFVNWALPHSSIYLPFSFRGEHLYSTICSRVLGFFFVAAYVYILFIEIPKIGSNKIHNDTLVNYQNNSQLAEVYKNVSDPYNNTNAPFYFMESAGPKTCEEFDKLSLSERQAIGVSAFSISPRAAPDNKTKFVSPLECVLDEDGDTLFKIKESDVQIYMSIVNPQYEDGKRVSIPNGHRISKLFQNYDFKDLIVSNLFTFTSFKGLCGMAGENEEIMSHMNYYNNFINNDFDTNEKGLYTTQIQTLNTGDFANNLCVDERDFSRDTYFMKQTTKNPGKSLLQKTGIQKLDASSTFQYDIMNTYGQNRVRNYTSNSYQSVDIMYFQDEYLDNSGLHTFYTRY